MHSPYLGSAGKVIACSTQATARHTLSEPYLAHAIGGEAGGCGSTARCTIAPPPEVAAARAIVRTRLCRPWGVTLPHGGDLESWTAFDGSDTKDILSDSRRNGSQQCWTEPSKLPRTATAQGCHKAMTRLRHKAIARLRQGCCNANATDTNQACTSAPRMPDAYR